MLTPTVRSPVNIQHVATFARIRGQHIVNIYSSHPPSDAVGQRIVQIKQKKLQNRPKSSKSCLKSLASCNLRPTTGVNPQHFQHLEGSSPCQHSTLLSTFRANGVNIQHKQLRRSRQRFPRWLSPASPPTVRAWTSRRPQTPQSTTAWM